VQFPFGVLLAHISEEHTDTGNYTSIRILLFVQLLSQQPTQRPSATGWAFIHPRPNLAHLLEQTIRPLVRPVNHLPIIASSIPYT